MIYLDTSCLLKLLRDEAESADVRKAVSREEIVVVSSLAELETEVQLKAAAIGGEIRTSQWRQYQAKLRRCEISIRSISATCQRRYFRRHCDNTGIRSRCYCRALGSVALAAMEELKMTQLITLDETQAKVALALNYEVIPPGRD